MHRSDDTTWLAADREQLLAALRKPLPPSRWPTTPKPVRVRWLRWRWQCTDPATGAEIEFGHAPTQRWAMHRRDAAAKRIHDEPTEAER